MTRQVLIASDFPAHGARGHAFNFVNKTNVHSFIHSVLPVIPKSNVVALARNNEFNSSNLNFKSLPKRKFEKEYKRPSSREANLSKMLLLTKVVPWCVAACLVCLTTTNADSGKYNESFETTCCDNNLFENLL